MDDLKAGVSYSGNSGRMFKAYAFIYTFSEGVDPGQMILSLFLNR